MNTEQSAAKALAAAKADITYLIELLCDELHRIDASAVKFPEDWRFVVAMQSIREALKDIVTAQLVNRYGSDVQDASRYIENLLNRARRDQFAEGEN
jgi:hypothetical protein